MKIIVKYKSDDKDTNFTRFSVLFGGRPVVISWDTSEKSVDGEVTTLICSKLCCKGMDYDPGTAELNNVKFAGAMWFNGERHPYGSAVEILHFAFRDDNGKEYQAKVRGGVMECGLQ